METKVARKSIQRTSKTVAHVGKILQARLDISKNRKKTISYVTIKYLA